MQLFQLGWSTDGLFLNIYIFWLLRPKTWITVSLLIKISDELDKYIQRQETELNLLIEYVKDDGNFWHLDFNAGHYDTLIILISSILKSQGICTKFDMSEDWVKSLAKI